MKKQKLIGIALFCLISLIAFCSFKGNGDKREFKTEKMSRGDIASTVTSNGTLNPVTTVLVGTQVTGTVKDIYVDYNSLVRKGQEIALIDPSTFEAQVEQSMADLASARAEAAKADAALLEARRMMDRNSRLFARSLISKSELEGSETSFETAKAQVDSTKARISQAQAALRYAETNLRYTRILAPVDGIVVSKNIDIGQTVVASFQTPTLFTIAKDLTKMQIDTNIDEADIEKIRKGQNAEFTVDACPNRKFNGRVSQIRNAPIFVQNVVTYDVVVTVENPDLKLRPGMTAKVWILTEKKKNVLRIPNAALRYVPRDTTQPAGFDGSCIWVIENAKPLCKKAVTGISDGSYTEYASGELQEGTDLITEEIVKKTSSSLFLKH